MSIRRWVFLALVLLGLAIRVWFVAAAGNTGLTFHSGGSDAPAYDLLARNLVNHRGFSYAGMPSAFRPPGYPILIAAAMSLSAKHYVLCIRLAQLALGLLTVGICYHAATDLFGAKAGRLSCMAGLFLPTMIFPTAQILTECLATLLTASFLFFLIRQEKDSDLGSAVGLGVTGGLETLIRFNSAVLPAYALWTVLQTRRNKSALLRGALVILLPTLILLPWLVRNEVVFGGRVLFSTHGGINAVEGVVAPEGRSQGDDSFKRKQAVGWYFPQLETNDPSRLALPSEPDLNQSAMQVVPGLWKELGWKALPLLARKVGYLWLSTDQLLGTKSFSITDRFLRIVGVICYWVVLGLAVSGWFRLRETRPVLASIFLTYIVTLTLLHLPLVMNTRLRIPLLEPLFVILAGGSRVKKAERETEVHEMAPLVT